jgi:hypothetical protein
MRARIDRRGPIPTTVLLPAGALLIVGLFAAAVTAASAQTASAPPAAPAPSIAEPRAPSAAETASNPGLVEELGRWFKRGTDVLPSIKPPAETFNELNATAKDATDNLTKLAKPSTIVKGRTVCPRAANGAPDCKAASDNLCQSNGFKEGKSLDTDSAENCPARVRLSGRQPEQGECRVDDYVIRALCQ